MNFRTSRNLAALGFVAVSLALGNNSARAQTAPVPRSDYEQAIELYNKADDLGAITLLQKVVRAEADHADAWELLGRAYYRNGLLWRARDAFEHLLRIRPDSADAQAKLSYTLILGGESALAVNAAQRAIELGDRSAEPHYAIAEANLRAGKYVEAVDQADQALKIKSNFGQALITKGMAHYYLNQYPEAIACFEGFLGVEPNDLDADVWRAQLERIRAYERQRKSPGAVAQTSEEQIFKGKDVTTKARVLVKPEPVYTEAARQAGVTGTVILKAVFSSRGEVTNVFVAQALSYGLKSRAVAAAKGLKFVPATKDGKPVSMWMELQYNFNLY